MYDIYTYTQTYTYMYIPKSVCMSFSPFEKIIGLVFFSLCTLWLLLGRSFSHPEKTCLYFHDMIGKSDPLYCSVWKSVHLSHLTNIP